MCIVSLGETFCIKFQALFSEKKNVIQLSSANFSQIVLKGNSTHLPADSLSKSSYFHFN